jgi:hypothetical protein
VPRTTSRNCFHTGALPAATLLLLSNLITLAPAQSTPGDANTVRQQRRDQQNEIDARSSSSTGIIVGQPKVYDDSQLQQMLTATQARLSTLQVLDQSGIASHLGSVTGASQSVTSFGLSVMGPTLPQVATTNNGATNSTVNGNTNTTATGATPGTTNVANNQTTTTTPVTNVTTTSPQVTPPTATAPAPSTSLPSTFGVSGADILDEQMQLTYQIANLRMLLNGSLTDWTIGTTKIVKPRVTLGFPITIDPDRRAKDATAVVEVEVERADVSDPSQELPALLTLLPQEKTYNVARITDKSVAISAGVATQAFSVAGSFLHGTKTYYLVKDTDTLATTFQPKDSKRIGFAWEFRPVLGQRYVRAGIKQTFVQIAFPTEWSATTFGKVHIRTYWKYYDRKQGFSKKVLNDSVRESPTDWPIANYSLEQIPKTFNHDSLQDLGNGQMMVTLFGRFLEGTYMRIGNSFLRDGNPAFLSEYRQIRFVASIADLSTKQVAVVARDGTEHILAFSSDPFGCPLTQPDVAFTSVDDTNTQVSLTFKGKLPDQNNFPLIMVIAGKAYGYSDAPIQRADKVLRVVVPTATLLANPTITTTSPFAPVSFWKPGQIVAGSYAQGTQSPKIGLLEQTDSGLEYLVYGPSLKDAMVIAPSGMSFSALPGDTSDSLRVITLTPTQAKSEKAIVFMTSNNLRFSLALPKADIPDENKYKLKPLKAVTIGDDEVIFQGESLTDLQKVLFNSAELKLRKQSDGKMVWISGLRASGATSDAKTQTLEFDFKSGKVNFSLSVSPKP